MSEQSILPYEEIPYEKRLDPRLLGGSTTIEPLAAACSSSRSAMRASFLTQMLVVEGATRRRIVTGAEREYAKYTMRVEVPCRCQVLRVVKKYPRNLGASTFKRNSETVIIYESLENGEMGSITVPTFHWNHKVFGFKYVLNPILKNLAPGMLLEKGTVLADSPSVMDNGDYKYGIQTSVAFMSVPGIVEDGVVASEAFCQKARSTGFGSATMEWGFDTFPLNLYGDDEEYKPFPDIGDPIRKDGVLFALREYDPVYAISDMTKDALREIDHTFDRPHYISLSSVDYDEPPIIEDIIVHHTHNPDLWKTPPTMEKQVRRYHDAIKIFNTSVYEMYESEHKRKRGVLNTTNEFHNLLVNCAINDNNLPKMQLPKSTVRTYRRAKLNDWRVELRYSWTITPGVGFKVTDAYGWLT